jgi:hypothetical protein
VLSFLLFAASRGLASETAVGVDMAHEAVAAYVERWLQRLEQAPAAL